MVALARVENDGTVFWIPPNVYRSQCSDLFDSSNFPYDEPQCSFKFGSWAWPAKMFDPYFSNEIADVQLAPFLASGRWLLTETWAKKNQAYYTCCPDTPFTDLTYSLKLRRGNIEYFKRILICVSFVPIILTSLG